MKDLHLSFEVGHSSLGWAALQHCGNPTPMLLGTGANQLSGGRLPCFPTSAGKLVLGYDLPFMAKKRLEFGERLPGADKLYSVGCRRRAGVGRLGWVSFSSEQKQNNTNQ